MNTTVDNQNATTTAEDKIRATATSLRDKRDKAHRDMQLSLERLRLVKQERDAIKKLTEDTKKNIETVEKESEEAKTTGLALKKDVAHLTKEFQFQHSELIHKNNKLAEQTTKMTNDKTVRDATLSKLRALVQARREKNAELQVRRLVGSMEMEWKDDKGDERLVSKMPQIIAKDEAYWKAETAALGAQNKELERVIEGYKELAKQIGYPRS